MKSKLTYSLTFPFHTFLHKLLEGIHLRTAFVQLPRERLIHGFFWIFLLATAEVNVASSFCFVFKTQTAIFLEAFCRPLFLRHHPTRRHPAFPLQAERVGASNPFAPFTRSEQYCRLSPPLIDPTPAAKFGRYLSSWDQFSTSREDGLAYNNRREAHHCHWCAMAWLQARPLGPCTDEHKRTNTTIVQPLKTQVCWRHEQFWPFRLSFARGRSRLEHSLIFTNARMRHNPPWWRSNFGIALLNPRAFDKIPAAAATF